MKEKYKTIGRNIQRIGAMERLKGEPVFCADLEFDRPLTLKVFRSTRAHARIKKIDVESALKVEGAVRVYHQQGSAPSGP